MRRRVLFWTGALPAIVLVWAGELASQAPRPFVYPVIAYQVTDGDSVRTMLDLGFQLRLDQTARLDGVDAPESSTAAGRAVAEFVQKWLDKQERLIVESVARDKYAGRYVARMYGDNGQCLNDRLLELKLVRPYAGDEKAEWDSRELALIETRAGTATLGLDAPSTASAPVAGLAPTGPTSVLPLLSRMVGGGGTSAQPASITVYVTRTGEKYHRAGCRHLASSSIAMSLSDAARGREPCSVCNPPRP